MGNWVEFGILEAEIEMWVARDPPTEPPGSWQVDTSELADSAEAGQQRWGEGIVCEDLRLARALRRTASVGLDRSSEWAAMVVDPEECAVPIRKESVRPVRGRVVRLRNAGIRVRRWWGSLSG